MKHHGALPEAGIATACGEFDDGDMVVPFDELWDPAGRYMDCKACGEAVAQDMGGSMQRPNGPDGQDIE